MTEAATENEQIKNLRQLAQNKQLWHKDKAFHNALNRSSEKGFSSLDDYMSKKTTYLKRVQAMRAAKEGVAERNSKTLAIKGAYGRLRPALVIIGIIAFVAYGLSNGLFFPKSERGLFSGKSKAATPTIVKVVDGKIATPMPSIPTALPTTVAVSLNHSDAAPRVVQPPRAISFNDFLRPLMLVSASLSVIFFGLFFLRRLTRKKKHGKGDIDTPEPEEQGAD